MPLTFQLTVFSDPQGEAAARVYLIAVPDRDATADELAGYRLTGQIIGPSCRYSSTLQTKIPFQHRGLTPSGDRTALLAEALVPDPCYWSTELPFLSRAVGQITGTDSGPTPFEQTFGIRSVGVLRNKLTFNGKVWVPRIIYNKGVAGATITQWRATETMMFIEDIDDSLGGELSEAGVLAMTMLKKRDENIEESLIRLSRYPAVALIWIEGVASIEPTWQTAARNVLLGRFNATSPIDSHRDATGFCCFAMPESSEPTGLAAAEATGLPLLAIRGISDVRTLNDARRLCDRTQRDLAELRHDVAGYIIS